MGFRHTRVLGIAVAVVGGWMMTAADGRAADDALVAEFRCPEVASPGRVVCEVRARALSDRLVWADSVVRRAPDFARPLRARVGPEQATRGADGTLRLALSLVATEVGQGEIAIDLRAVLCDDEDERCAPRVRPLVAVVRVGNEP